jgi:hypothetical protein
LNPAFTPEIRQGDPKLNRPDLKNCSKNEGGDKKLKKWGLKMT